MRYLKLFESQSIEEICKKCNIKNYHINSDGTVDVDSNVYLAGYKLDKIPLKFGNISGGFNCDRNNLTNLIGSPRSVGKYFSCDDNKNLTSLEGCPEYIGGNFWCQYNPNLWSFDHFPRHAKGVKLYKTPIEQIFHLFRNEYLLDGGKFFTTRWSLMEFFWDMDPVYPGKIIKKWRLNKFLEGLNKKLSNDDIKGIEKRGWKIQ